MPDAVVVSYDAMTDTISITDDDITDTLEANTLLDTQGFTGYRDSFFASFASRAETSSGNGVVTVVVSQDSAFGVSGTFLERTGETTIPTTGTANFTGNYLSLIHI